MLVYTGTYSRRGSRGIYAHRFDPATGKVAPIGLVAETSNPSFLAVHPNKRFLYAANEDSEGAVSGFAIDAAGRLTPLNRVSSKGGGPCHLAFDRTAKWLFAANYNNGSVAVLPVRNDGTLGEASASIQHFGSSVDPARQTGPHAHSVNVSPDNRFLLVADLGLDRVLAYRFDPARGALAPADPPFAKIAGGSGPRHLAWSPNGKYVYVLNEMNATVTALTYDKETAALREFQTVSALPEGFSGNPSAAEIAVNAKGKFLYTSNRGHDSIARFDIDKNGRLTFRDATPSGGNTPRHFALDAGGGYFFAANQDSNGVAVFKIDPETGALTATGVTFEVISPVCIVLA
jgi:6-phosphogluconolactonase